MGRVGSWVGATVGRLDGIWEGTRLGASEGIKDGTRLGRSDGIWEGDSVIGSGFMLCSLLLKLNA